MQPVAELPLVEDCSVAGNRFVMRIRQFGRAWELIHPHQPPRFFYDQSEAFDRAEHLALAHYSDTGAPAGVVVEIPGVETLAVRFD